MSLQAGRCFNAQHSNGSRMVARLAVTPAQFTVSRRISARPVCDSIPESVNSLRRIRIHPFPSAKEVPEPSLAIGTHGRAAMPVVLMVGPRLFTSAWCNGSTGSPRAERRVGIQRPGSSSILPALTS